MIKINKYILTSGIIIIIFLTSVFVYLYKSELAFKQVLSRCSDYSHWEWDIIDCYGVVSLQSNKLIGEPPYTIFDHKRDYDIALISSADDFKVSGNYLYVIGRKEDRSIDGITKEYGVILFRGEGGRYESEYSSEDSIPLYRKVEYKTGIVTPYLKYDEMPAEDQAIFHELEARIAQK